MCVEKSRNWDGPFWCWFNVTNRNSDSSTSQPYMTFFLPRKAISEGENPNNATKPGFLYISWCFEFCGCLCFLSPTVFLPLFRHPFLLQHRKYPSSSWQMQRNLHNAPSCTFSSLHHSIEELLAPNAMRFSDQKPRWYASAEAVEMRPSLSADPFDAPSVEQPANPAVQ